MEPTKKLAGVIGHQKLAQKQAILKKKAGDPHRPQVVPILFTELERENNIYHLSAVPWLLQV